MQRCVSSGCIPYCKESVKEHPPPPPCNSFSIASSRIEWIPFQRKVIQYKTEERIEMVPRQRIIIQYQPVKHCQQVPVQRIIDDVYPVQYITDYVPNYIPEKKIQYIPIQKVEQKVEYYPVQRRVEHPPQDLKCSEYSGPTNFSQRDCFSRRRSYFTDFRPSFYNYRRRYGRRL